MNVDSAVTWLTWLLAAIAAVAVVLVVFIRRWAGRIAIVGVAALLAILAFTARQQISRMSTDSPQALCNAGISWFGVQLTGPESLCAKYRNSP